MIKFHTQYLALAAVACLGATALAQTESPGASTTAAPRPVPGTVLTDESVTGPRTGTSGTGNATGTTTIIRNRAPVPNSGRSGGTVSPSAGTSGSSTGTGIVPGRTTGTGAATTGTPAAGTINPSPTPGR